MTWPARNSLCLDCRSTVPAGQPCRAGRSHRVRSLEDPAGREQLLHEVWGPPPLRARMRQVAKDGAKGGTTGGLLEGGLGDCGIDVGFDPLSAIIFAVIVVALAFILIAWLVRMIAAFARRRRHQLEPTGALAPPASVSPRSGRAGTVVGAVVASPLSGRWCAAFDARLTHGPRREVVLHDAATIGFDVALDDGARVRIPAGSLLVDRGEADPVALSEHHVDVYLRALDPRRATADDLDPFPYHRIEEALIRPGDRIEVLGALRAVVDGAARPTGYRDAAATILVPDGPAQLRLLDPQQA